MSTIRLHKKEANYSVVDNYFVNDKSLSWKAKGLLMYLLSKQDDWSVYVSHLATVSKDGRDATANCIKELMKAGYIHRTGGKDKDGRFKYDYVVHERPSVEQIKEEPVNTETCTGNPQRKTRNGKSVTENPHLVNTDEVSTDKVNTDRVKEKKKSAPIEVPSLEEFLKYGQEKCKELGYAYVKQPFHTKYLSWHSAGWKKQSGTKQVAIKAWKTTLLNTMPYMKLATSSTASQQEHRLSTPVPKRTQRV